MANAFTNQIGTYAIAFQTSTGAPADVQAGSLVVTSSDETVLRVDPAQDPKNGNINTVAPGTARIAYQADADLGDGVTTISGFSEDIVVTQNPNSQASSAVITIGTFHDPV